MIAAVSPADDRAFVVDDLDEEFRQRLERDGVRAARGWYRAQVVRSIVPLIGRRMRGGGFGDRPALSMAGDRLLQDIRYALRSLRRRPSFSIVAITMLAIALGANMAIFGIMNALLLRSMPGVAEADDLVEISRNLDGSYFDMSYPVLESVAAAGALEGLAPVAMGRVSVGADGGPEIRPSLSVTSAYFELLRQAPAVGRFFRTEEATFPATAPVVVLSHRFWNERFGGSPDAIGATLRLNGVPVEVIGVAAAGFTGHGPLVTDLFVPLGLGIPGLRSRRELEGPENGVLEALGRLRPGASLPTVRSALTAAADRFLVDAVGSQPGTYELRVEAWAPVPAAGRGPVKAFFALLLTVVGLVLAIACVNVAGLLLARSVERGGEIGVRAALGASGSRIARQLFTETMVLFAVAGVAGALVSEWVLRLLLGFQPPLPAGFVIELDTQFDIRMLGCALGLTFAAALFTNLVAASRAGRVDLADVLRRAGRRGLARSKLQRGLVGVQMAGSLVLLVAAGLFTRALVSMRGMDPGWDPEGVVVSSYDLELTGTPDAAGANFYRAIEERVAALPGVRVAGLSAKLPLAGFSSFGDVHVAGVPVPEGRIGHTAYVGRVTAGYFEALSLDLTAGRLFDEQDREDGDRVAIVNRAMADRFWPAGDAVGAQFRVGGSNGAAHTVIGVVENASYKQLIEETPNFYYVPHEQRYNAAMYLFIRTAPGMAQQVADGVVRTVADLQPDLPVSRPRPLVDQLRFALLPQRLAAWIAGAMGTLGLLMGAVGVYGVTAIAVRNRHREIGVRMALGAGPLRLFADFVGQGMGPPLIGAVFGLAAAAGLAQIIRAVVPGVNALDIVAFGGALSLLLVVALVSVALPVGRVLSRDPVRSLHID